MMDTDHAKSVNGVLVSTTGQLLTTDCSHTANNKWILQYGRISSWRINSSPCAIFHNRTILIISLLRLLCVNIIILLINVSHCGSTVKLKLISDLHAFRQHTDVFLVLLNRFVIQLFNFYCVFGFVVIFFIFSCNPVCGQYGANSEQYYIRSVSKNFVKIKYGSLQGLVFHLDTIGGANRSDSVKLSPIEAYLGVPYASPPTGALRFMPPVTPSHWRGVKQANQLSPLCPQKIPFADIVRNNATEALKQMPLARFEWLRRLLPKLSNQSEDCLYLNIYTPAIELSTATTDHDGLYSVFILR